MNERAPCALISSIFGTHRGPALGHKGLQLASSVRVGLKSGGRSWPSQLTVRRPQCVYTSCASYRAASASVRAAMKCVSWGDPGSRILDLIDSTLTWSLVGKRCKVIRHAARSDERRRRRRAVVAGAELVCWCGCGNGDGGRHRRDSRGRAIGRYGLGRSTRAGR
jgi:hypothetical protein